MIGLPFDGATPPHQDDNVAILGLGVFLGKYEFRTVRQIVGQLWIADDSTEIG